MNAETERLLNGPSYLNHKTTAATVIREVTVERFDGEVIWCGFLATTTSPNLC
jgi:hypothetical protein